MVTTRPTCARARPLQALLLQAALLQGALVLGACAGPRWSAVTPGRCARAGVRLHTAILENVAADASGQDVCRKKPATIGGVEVTATVCRPLCAQLRGEFEVADPSCALDASDPMRLARARIIGCADLEAQAVKSLVEMTRRHRAGTRLRDLSDAALHRAADACGFRSMTISLVGDVSALVGVNVSPGVAFGVLDCQKPRGIATAGVSLGAPGASADASLQVGFWEATVDNLAGRVTVFTVGAHAGGGADFSAFFAPGVPLRLEGVSFGLGTGAGVEMETGTAVTAYTDTLLLAAHDAGRILTLDKTRRGAELGQACRVGADCKGYRLPVGDRGGVACCRRRCAMTRRDWAGTWWCPRECRKAPFARRGSCR